MHIIQRKILEASKNCNLGALSLRGIANLVGEEHPQKIKFHLGQLKKKGLINIDTKKKKIVAVANSSASNNGLIAIPILGSANCGKAMLWAEERIEGFLKVSSKIIKKKKGIFALRAVGNSLNQANIDGKAVDDGDYVIVDSEARNPSNGNYVVSVIDGLANIKKFYWDDANDQVVLYSESDQHLAPIFIHPDDINDYLVGGIVVNVLKKPRFVS